MGAEIKSGEVFVRLVELLTDAKAKFRVIEHAHEGKSEAISAIRGNRPDQAAKAMVLDVRGGGGGKVGGGQPLLCRCQDDLCLAVAEPAERLSCGDTDRPLPGANVLERRDEHAIERANRPLLFYGGERDRLAPAGQLLRQRLGRLEHR